MKEIVKPISQEMSNTLSFMDRPGGQASSPNPSAVRISSLAKLVLALCDMKTKLTNLFWAFKVVVVLQITETFGIAFYNHK